MLFGIKDAVDVSDFEKKLEHLGSSVPNQPITLTISRFHMSYCMLKGTRELCGGGRIRS